MNGKKVTNKIKIKKKYPKIFLKKTFSYFYLARVLSIPKNTDNITKNKW